MRPKTLIEITCQKVCRDHCTSEAQSYHGSVAGFGALAPNWIRPASLQAQLGPCSEAMCEVVSLGGPTETQRLTLVKLP